MITKTAKYDPNEPVSTHNIYPKELWPYKKGELVYVIIAGGGCQSISKGRVTFYNPALETTILITKDRPVITVRCGKPSLLFGLEEVGPRTRSGYRKLQNHIVARLLNYRNYLKSEITRINEKIVELE